MPKANTFANMVAKMRKMSETLQHAKDVADAVTDSMSIDDDKYEMAMEYADKLDDVIYSLNEAADALEEIA